MPSVMDFIRFREKLTATPQMARTIFFNDAITWLETEEINRCSPQYVEKYKELIEILKQGSNMIQIEEAWFSKFQYTYGGLGCMDKLLRRLK